MTWTQSNVMKAEYCGRADGFQSMGGVCKVITNTNPKEYTQMHEIFVSLTNYNL